MSFGGFCPLPLRLRDSAADGLSAPEFLRLTADLAAAQRAIPFAVARLSRNAGETEVELLDYLGRHDEAQVPTVGVSSGDIQITWPAALRDRLGAERPLRLTKVTVGVEGSAANTVAAALGGATNRVTVTDTAGGPLAITVVVWGRWGSAPRVEDYGGDPDKRSAETEVVPYAYQEYQELGAALGSAYGSQTSGSIHARRLALARALAATYRADERARANTVPSTADALLDDWVRTLRVPVATSDPNWLVRRRCGARFAAASGGNLVDLEAALVELLGDRYVGLRTFDDPDDPGTWPSSYDLGPGVWASNLSKILVDVAAPADTTDREFSRLITVQFVQLMDRMVPSWCVFDWTDTSGNGFYLDVSPLDFTGL